MKTILKIFAIFCVSLFVMTSCSKDEVYTPEVNPVDTLTSKTWKVEVDDTIEEYVSTVTIVLNRSHTYRYTQNILCDDENINVSIDGNWSYDENSKTISLTFTDNVDNTQYIEKGIVDFNSNTISIQNKQFKY